METPPVNDAALTRGGRTAASVIVMAAACLAAGWAAHSVVSPAQAADRAERIERIEETVRKLDKNMARVMDKLGVAERP